MTKGRIFFVIFVAFVSADYQVTFQRINGNKPVINSQRGDSVFKWNYNAAVAPIPVDNSIALMVRCQNQSNPNDPYSVTSSVLSFTKIQGNFNPNDISFADIYEDSVVFEPNGPTESYGTEDPRIVYRESTQEYYMLYSAVQGYPNGTVISRLALATSQNPADKSTWKRYGPIIPTESWSKSGAMLIRDGSPGPHYLIFGDSSIYPGLQVATSTNLINWNVLPDLIIKTRSDMFDSALVEAGPMPLMLSDGNYLFIYNSARHGYPSRKPGWDMQYNVGWIILDGTNPTNVLQRSNNPLFSPELDWEIGNPPYLDLTPNVVFLEGWVKLGGENSFLVFYGGADSVIGAGIINVTITP